MLSIADICTWAEANPSSRNFIEGERLLSSKHVIYCGKSAESDSQQTKILAFCLQTSGLKERPHEINCEFGNNGQILSVKCSCKAGLSEKCKHAVAVLLFCNRTSLEDLEVTSCTDKKCLWNSRQKQSLENLYNPLPLTDHDCFTDCKDNELEISNDLRQIIREKLVACNPLSAVAKHASGRHTSVLPCTRDGLSEAQRHEINVIICNSESSPMENLAEIPFKPLTICCETVLD